jgi:two-component system chemotaxis response regulator CheB
VDILRQSAAVGVRWLDDGEHLDRGWAYVAPPGRHVVVNPDGRLALLDAPRVGYARLTANPLFASAAETYGRDAIAVVLTGWLFDKALIALTMMPGTMAMFRRPVAV